MKYELTDDLKGGKHSFFESLKNKDFYTEEVLSSGHNIESRVLRFHGPYPIEEISPDAYVSIDFNESVKLLELTLDNPEFNNGFPFSQTYRNEAIELLQDSLAGQREIYWLNRKMSNERLDYWGRYDFWAEFVARNERELYYITIGED